MRTTDDKPLAVVTGGASGIGAAVVRHFQAEKWRVVIADCNEDAGRALSATLENTFFIPLDVAEEASVLSLAETVHRDHGIAAALINSAGILQNATRISEMALNEFDTIMSVNLRGALLCSRAFGVQMAGAGQGSIITLCSVTSLRAAPQPAYAMSKAGLLMMTEILAAELGPSGVRVNAVAPGYTMTPRMHQLIEHGERDPTVAARTAALRRFVTPEEVADGVAFLCSDRARAITGAFLPIDAGWLVGASYGAYAAKPKE
jgi:NAD(P)-dependent dehydrogenase (short-subunit alcohol dehydrogenase family)